MFNDKISQEDKTHKFILRGMGVTEKPMGVFRINDDTGIVEALGPIDREEYPLFHVS